jgi:hypothetical protein
MRRRRDARSLVALIAALRQEHGRQLRRKLRQAACDEPGNDGEKRGGQKRSRNAEEGIVAAEETAFADGAADADDKLGSGGERNETPTAAEGKPRERVGRHSFEIPKPVRGTHERPRRAEDDQRTGKRRQSKVDVPHREDNRAVVVRTHTEEFRRKVRDESAQDDQRNIQAAQRRCRCVRRGGFHGAKETHHIQVSDGPASRFIENNSQ